VRVRAGREAAARAEWTDLGWPWKPSELLADAYVLPEDAKVAASAGYLAGDYEIQDLGSQLILAAVAPATAGHWLDACAGAGGKTLQLAALLGPAGRIDVHDVRPEALAELGRRAERAGCAGQIRRHSPGAGTYDGVLIDAPCSGSGTWRRAPHLKWTTQPGDLRAYRLRQEALLGRFAVRVRPGGLLVYATCSLCRGENEGALESFLSGSPEFAPEAPARPFTSRPAGAGFQFWPAGHDGDGFFAAILRRR
jgi:16S rRNA (cytosine967-C5)-methyltransferase